jgi:hypothetical protein
VTWRSFSRKGLKDDQSNGKSKEKWPLRNENVFKRRRTLSMRACKIRILSSSISIPQVSCSEKQRNRCLNVYCSL